MKSAARAHLARMIAERGVNGALLIFTVPPESLGVADEGPRPPTGPVTFPPCQCPQHRAGLGVPDTAVRLTVRDESDDSGRGDA